MAMTWNHFLIQKLSAFDYGTDGLCEGGVWGSGQLEDHSKQPSQHCASIPTGQICGGKFISSSKNLPTSYNSSSSSYTMTLSSSHIYPYHSPFLFSISTTNTGCSQINRTESFLYSRLRSCDEQPNCSVPLGTKSPSIITVENGQPQDPWMQTNWMLWFIWHLTCHFIKRNLKIND